MVRLWLTFGAAWTLCGCSHRTPAGTWAGALPIEGAEECRVRIVDSGVFEFSCTPAKSGWSGHGLWSDEGGAITLRFIEANKGSQWISRRPVPIRLRYGEDGKMLAQGVDRPWTRIAQ